MDPLVRAVIALGLLVVVPLGLALLPASTTAAATSRVHPRSLWYVGAIPGAVSLWLPRGALAAILAACLAVAVIALFPALHPHPFHLLHYLVHLWALLTLGIAATALVAERSGFPLFGFSPAVLTLTAAHFQFAGFAAALIAGLLCYDQPTSTSTSASTALCVPIGTATVLVGFFTSLWIQFAGASVLTTGMWLVGWLTWRDLASATSDPVARLLLRTGAATLAVTMLLALDWSLGRAANLPHFSLAVMAATHGIANALGFALCTVVARHRLQRSHTTR